MTFLSFLRSFVPTCQLQVAVERKAPPGRAAGYQRARLLDLMRYRSTLCSIILRGFQLNGWMSVKDVERYLACHGRKPNNPLSRIGDVRRLLKANGVPLETRWVTTDGCRFMEWRLPYATKLKLLAMQGGAL